VTVEQTEDGCFAVSADEMRILRQGLFVTIHHGDDAFRSAAHTITGYELDEFHQLMWQIDELNGHNDEIRRLLSGQIEELGALSLPELKKRAQLLRDVVGSADRYGVDVPLRLREGQAPPS
jgi:hypothetical protein